MEIESTRLSRLRNEEHFQFQNEFNKLIVKFTPAALGIESKYALYQPLYANELTALDLVMKSSVTDPLVIADEKRDTTYGGMRDFVKSACNHYNPTVKQAAARIQLILDYYGNVAIKPNDAETGSLYKLVDELRQNHAESVSTIGLGGWIDELEANNIAFDTLLNQRYTESAGKTLLRMKQVRVEVDAAYRGIVKRINSLIEVNGEEAYIGFVNDLNQRSKNFNRLIAQREGRNESDDETEEPGK